MKDQNTPTNTLEKIARKFIAPGHTCPKLLPCTLCDGVKAIESLISEAVNKALTLELKNLLKNSEYKSYVTNKQIDSRIRELENPKEES